MVSESIAIVTVLILIVLISLKAQYRSILPLVLPFFSVPICYLFSTVFSPMFAEKQITNGFWTLGLVVVGGILGCIFVLIVSLRIPAKAIKAGYTIFGLVFSAAFTLAYIVNLT